jgi:hypothetical protein
VLYLSFSLSSEKMNVLLANSSISPIVVQQIQDIHSDYEKLKNLADKINKLSSDVHLRVFDILKANNIHFSTNKNGVFVNFEHMPDSVVTEINDIIRLHESRRALPDNRKTKLQQQQSQNEQQNNCTPTTPLNVPQEVASAGKGKQSVSSRLFEECKEMVKATSNDTSNIQTIWNHFEKEKVVNKKCSVNKFVNAKKKYGRQIITESKHSSYCILDRDTGNKMCS